MKVTCTNPNILFHVYHIDNDHYFVAYVVETSRKIQAHAYGEGWLEKYYQFIDNVIEEVK